MQIDTILEKMRRTVDSHRLCPGQYARYLWQDEKNTRKLGCNEYGCADAANLLYTLGCFPSDPAERKAWVTALQSMQNPETGLFHEATHHPFHTTAHCVAALELFDALPIHPLREMLPYLETEALFAKLSSLGWRENPWPQSHQGAGLYAALTITGEASLAWRNAYFGWLAAHSDPNMGMGMVGSFGQVPDEEHLYGWFHYLFCHEASHHPFPYPEKLIDTCLALYDGKRMDTSFGRYVGFREIDWVYSLNRASRQTGHRFAETREKLEAFGEGFVRWLEGVDDRTHEGWNDLHMLFGAACALAELQQALPGKFLSEKPLRLVLDRRPFI